MIKTLSRKRWAIVLIAIVMCGLNVQSASAQTDQNAFVPLIGLTVVPEPLALPKGAGSVTYHYAVKNFLKEAALTSVRVTDDKCSPVAFTEGDDNSDGKLDYRETWRYACTTVLSTTTQSSATATGMAYNIVALHKAYPLVIVGSDTLPPLVSIINITKVAYPLSLPAKGGPITFVYRVNNPGAVPLSNVVVSDDKCPAMSSKLGDTNGNNLLDVYEVWIYSCTTTLTETTTNTVKVSAFANGLKATGDATLTVKVAALGAEENTPNLPDTGKPATVKIMVWTVLLGILVALVVFFLVQRKNKK